MSGEINLIKDTTFASKLDAQNTLLSQIVSGMGAVVDSSFVANSTNPVQSQVIKTALDDKVDKEQGKGLSTNDFDNTYKGKLDNVDSTVTASSGNLITSGAVATAISNLGNIATVKGVVAAKTDLPASGNKTGDIYFVGTDGLLDDNFEEYIWTANSKWEFVGTATVTITVDSVLNTTSENPVQNKVVNSALEDLRAMVFPELQVSGTANTAFTLTKGGRTISSTIPAGGTATILIPDLGTWTIAWGANSDTIDLSIPMTLTTFTLS